MTNLEVSELVKRIGECEREIANCLRQLGVKESSSEMDRRADLSELAAAACLRIPEGAAWEKMQEKFGGE